MTDEKPKEEETKFLRSQTGWTAVLSPLLNDGPLAIADVCESSKLSEKKKFKFWNLFSAGLI